MSERADDCWTVERHLATASDRVSELYSRFIEMVEAIGPFSYAVSKTGITLKGTRRGFAGASVKPAALTGYFDLQRMLPETGTDVRVRGASPYTKRLFVHQFRITEPGHLDAAFAGWLREAYAVGRGDHLLG